VRTYALTCQADTRIHFGFDEDDPNLEVSIAATGGHRYSVRPRMGLAAWTNHLAKRHKGARALGSFGDDHVPVTAGWDKLLLDAIPARGGFAYPNDMRRVDIPEAWVQSGKIADALGWMALPGSEHWCIDNAVRDLGAPELLVYCQEVIVRHLHPNVAPRESANDMTYVEAAQTWNADMVAYQKWRLLRMRQDRATVRAACDG
jgi:hypothetical protein